MYMKAWMTINVDSVCFVVETVYDVNSHFIRVLIPAVSKKTINPKLHIFNNCFDDMFSTRKWIYIDLLVYMRVKCSRVPVCSFTIYHRACL